jgi:hypothetical protein
MGASAADTVEDGDAGELLHAMQAASETTIRDIIAIFVITDSRVPPVVVSGLPA